MRLSDQIAEETEAGTIVVQLLPTPMAQPSGNSPEEHLRKKPGRTVVTDLAVMAENGLIATGGRLLPTPTAMDREASGGSNASNVTLTDAVVRTDLGRRANERLLPTPEAKLATSGPDYARMGRDGSGGDDLTTTLWREGMHEPPLTPAAAMGVTDWGPYALAIARWERIIGRPAPAPVRYDGRGGAPRLNPELTEWMMGWPAGHVTAPEIGLTRAEQLKACGNGVVPQQALEAILRMLRRPGVPAAERQDAA